MFKTFGQTFKLLNENMILTTPLVLFLLLLTLYLGIAKSMPQTLVAQIVLLITIISMLVAFGAGWFYMIKQAIKLFDTEFKDEMEKAKASLALFKDFTAGVGEYFLPFLGVVIIYFLLTFTTLFLAYKIGVHFIGKLDFSILQTQTMISSQEMMEKFITSLPVNEAVKMMYWNFLLIATFGILGFCLMFFIPTLLYKTKNPIKALFLGLKYVFKNFLTAIVLFLYIASIKIVVSILNALAMPYPIVYLISMVFYFYMISYILVLLFNVFDKEVKN